MQVSKVTESQSPITHINITAANKTSPDNLKNPIEKNPNYKIYSQEQAFRHMTKKRSDKEQLLYMIIDDVLFNVWDCCYLSINEQYREEYLPFLPHVFDLLLVTTEGNDIFDYLIYIEEVKFHAVKGDVLSRKRAYRVVDLLLEYKETILSNEQRGDQKTKTQRTNISEPYPA